MYLHTVMYTVGRPPTGWYSIPLFLPDVHGHAVPKAKLDYLCCWCLNSTGAMYTDAQSHILSEADHTY